jgi:hypothetical protein
MKKIYGIISIALALALVCQPLRAQDLSAYYNKMDSIFQHLNRDDVASGLLGDYGIDFVDFTAFNGVPSDTNYVTLPTWNLLYASIFSAQFGTNATLSVPDSVMATIEAADKNAVAIMHFDYQALNPEALDLGYVTIVDEQIIPVAGQPLPYVDKELFAVAPKRLYFDDGAARFVFTPQLMVGNTGKTVQSIEVRFHDDGEFLPATWDAPISFSYATDGQKTITFRVTCTDGSSLSSHTNILVKIPDMIQMTYNSGNRTDITIPATGQHAGGNIQIQYSRADRTLRKPLIVAEGFDPSGILNGKEYTIRNFLEALDQSQEFGNLSDSIQAAGYDIVFLNYNDGVDDIRRNAKLFEAVIDSVNKWKAPNSATGEPEPNVVMGLSMGGLVARYALRTMEVAHKDHQTWKYISVDSPHKGANVPVGVQALVRHFMRMEFSHLFWRVSVNSMIPMLPRMQKLLNSPAAKQMLIYYVAKELSYNHSEHASFMREYESLGFPQQCQNVAVASGAGNATLAFPPLSGAENRKTPGCPDVFP